MIEQEGGEPSTKKGTRYKICGPTPAGKFYIKRSIKDELGQQGWKPVKTGFFMQNTWTFDTFLEAKSGAISLRDKEKVKQEQRSQFKEIEIDI